MLQRQLQLSRLTAALSRSPVAVLLGPRQCGKTTLARQLAEQHPGAVAFFDLENPLDASRLGQPLAMLGPLRGLVVIDEVQHRPDILAVVRVLVDRPESAAQFLLLGSASPQLVQETAESLAGRAALVELGGFDVFETGVEHWQTLWVRGGFPRSYLARSDEESLAWRHDFIQLFLQRDLPQLGVRIPAVTLRRFWTMVAHYHGQTWNASEIARSLGVTQPTARSYLDLLTQAFVVRQLPPWFENLSKRQVKAPKVYVRDSGLVHALLDIDSWASLTAHPKLGASWEGLVLEHVLHLSGAREAYFWATQGGAELDLLLIHHGRRLGFEIKFQDAPRTTKSMHVALTDLRLDRLYVVYPGDQRFPLDAQIECLPLAALQDVLAAG